MVKMNVMRTAIGNILCSLVQEKSIFLSKSKSIFCPKAFFVKVLLCLDAFGKQIVFQKTELILIMDTYNICLGITCAVCQVLFPNILYLAYENKK